jgi:hypothetical protein
MLPKSPRRVIALGAKREDEQDRSVLRQREELFEQLNGRRIGPVEILERQHERRFLRQPEEELADDLERPPLQRLRRELRRARLGFVLERHFEQAAEVRIELVGRRPGRSKRPGNYSAGRRRLGRRRLQP